MNLSGLLTNKNIPNLVVSTCFSRAIMVGDHLISQASALFPCRHLIRESLVKYSPVIIHLQIQCVLVKVMHLPYICLQESFKTKKPSLNAYLIHLGNIHSIYMN